MNERDVNFFKFLVSVNGTQELDLTRWSEAEQIDGLFCQFLFLLNLKPSSLLEKTLLMLNSYKLNLPNYPTIAENYKKFSEGLKSIQT
jgi:hypothetical protein